MSETLKVNGLCRCCFSEGEFRSLDDLYRSDGSDSYSALLRETLNITISPMPGPENASTYTICDGCTNRLQDAAQFRNQVLECETKFAAYVENYLKGDCSFSADKIQIEAETLQDEEIKHIKEEKENVNAMSPDEGENYINEFDCKIEVGDDGNRIGGDARYTCDISNDIFCRKDKLRCHVLDNHICSQDSRDYSGLSCNRTLLNNYQCAFCTDTFPKFKSLKSHEHAHTKQSGFICDYCQKSFNDKNKLKKHINYHTGNYRCETCGNFLKTASGLRIHIRNVHEKIRAFKCDLCPKTYKAKSVLIEHRSTHTGEFPYKCDVCFKSFSFQSNFIDHKQIHLLKSFKQDQARIGTDNLNNKCPICGKSFKKKSILRRHLNIHTKPFQCDACGKSFSRKAYMVQHQKQHDVREKETKAEIKNCSGNKTDDVDYSCDFCKQSFCGKEKIRSHLLAKHMPLDPRNISCASCGIKFRGRETCLKHLMLHKTAQYHCDFCIDTFPTPSSLKTHEKTHIKTYTCDYCQRSFKYKYNLIHHINSKHYKRVFIQNKKHATQRVRDVNENIRPFKCDVCPKTYKYNKHLLDHKKVIHTGVLSYKCDVCSRCFRSKSNINQHKLRYKH